MPGGRRSALAAFDYPLQDRFVVMNPAASGAAADGFHFVADGLPVGGDGYQVGLVQVGGGGRVAASISTDRTVSATPWFSRRARNPASASGSIAASAFSAWVRAASDGK